MEDDARREIMLGEMIDAGRRIMTKVVAACLEGQGYAGSEVTQIKPRWLESALLRSGFARGVPRS